jgi:hypothetical protein
LLLSLIEKPVEGRFGFIGFRAARFGGRGMIDFKRRLDLKIVAKIASLFVRHGIVHALGAIMPGARGPEPAIPA